jgi:hypothetical protein
MKTILGLGVMTALLAGVGGVLAVGWAYEGPRRFIRRVRLRKGEGLMCWLGWHMWRLLPEDWGVRQCRICKVREQAMYHSVTGLYWIRL